MIWEPVFQRVKADGNMIYEVRVNQGREIQIEINMSRSKVKVQLYQ